MTDRGSTLIEVVAASAVLAVGASSGLMAWSHLGALGTRVTHHAETTVDLMALRGDVARGVMQGTLCDTMSNQLAVTVRVEPGCDASGPWQVWIDPGSTHDSDSRSWWMVVP